MSRRLILILVVSGLLMTIAGRQYIVARQASHRSSYVNSVLAVRGFRHAGIQVPTGESAEYDVDVGEEFKVTWETESLSENGQILYHGPAGVGAGLVSVPMSVTASQGTPFLQFTPKAPGTAQFSLTTTGPGPDGIYTLTSILTVHIK